MNPVVAGLLGSRKAWITLAAAGITLGAALNHEIAWSDASKFFSAELGALVFAIGLEDMGKSAQKIAGENNAKVVAAFGTSLVPPRPPPALDAPELDDDSLAVTRGTDPLPRPTPPEGVSKAKPRT